MICRKPTASFLDICKKLEMHYKDMQDVEFTIERGKLVDAADPQRQAHRPAAVKIAVDMVNEGLIDQRRSRARVTPEQVDTLAAPAV